MTPRKPWSSDRCKSKYGYYRCHLRKAHAGPHTAPVGTKRAEWMHGPHDTTVGRIQCPWKRRPNHYAVGTTQDSACGIYGLWHRGLSHTRKPEEVTCRHCLAWMRRQAPAVPA